MSVTVLHGDMLERLAELPDASVDSCVCDPPYGLAFMGKRWDHGVPGVDYWRAVYRILKPGAHVFAFGGTRTYHRMVCAIEDAGFEIRDQFGFMYGSGFPKSLNVAKAIDKAAGTQGTFGAPKSEAHAGWIERGRMRGGEGHDGYQRPWMDDPAAVNNAARQYITATPEAAKWQGWGTAAKPSFEPICLARKPLDGTVAANVLKWGTGALNIDACRVSSSNGQRPNGDDTWEQESTLCASCAALAGSSKKHSAPATRASIATSGAAPTLSGTDPASRGDTSKTATGCCNGQTQTVEEATYSSTGRSGKTATGRSQTGTSFTTSTGSEPTTGSKICNSCGATIMRRTMPGSTKPAKKNLPQGQRLLDDIESASDKTQNGLRSSGPEAGKRTVDCEDQPARWPPNSLHDGSPEVLAAFARFGELTSGTGAVIRATAAGHRANAFGAESRPEGTPMASFGDSGTAARFFPSLGFGDDDLRFWYGGKAGADDRLASKHPTVKPVALMRWLVRLVTPPNGTVLDPFAGTGTTGAAAIREGFNAILVEREAEYVADIRRRLAHIEGADTPLFAGAAE